MNKPIHLLLAGKSDRRLLSMGYCKIGSEQLLGACYSLQLL
jgi:hypothetical protein